MASPNRPPDNPAAIRLLPSMDNGDDDMAQPSRHFRRTWRDRMSETASGVGTTTASDISSSVPDITRPLSSSSYVPPWTSNPETPSPRSAMHIPSSPHSPRSPGQSKVAAAVSMVEERERQHQFDLHVAGTPPSHNSTTDDRSSTSQRKPVPAVMCSPTAKLQRRSDAGVGMETTIQGIATATTKRNETTPSKAAGSWVLPATPGFLDVRLGTPIQKSLGTLTVEMSPQPDHTTRTASRETLRTNDFHRFRPSEIHDPFRRSFEGSQTSSILDPPVVIPPPISTAHARYHGRQTSPTRPSPTRPSPTRPWSPSRLSHVNMQDTGGEYSRVPPAGGNYEPVDLHGSPRPGTPSSHYGGSPRRPLPPAPLFSRPSDGPRTSTFADDATVSISLGDDENVTDVSGRHSHGPSDYRYDTASRVEDDDDVFGPQSEVSGVSGAGGHPLYQMHTNGSQETLANRDVGGGPDDMTEIYHGKSKYGDDDDYYSEGDGDVANAKSEKVEHYGPAPEGRQERRGVRAPQMSKKEVQLINGELVLECKIPTILFSFLPRRDEIEFTHMRYTAVTCDPDDFVQRGYKLRQNIGRTARETELFICVTMYNEDEYDFTRTMHAVMKNIAHFCGRNKSRTWGDQGWQKIVVCVVSDGREKIHPRTLDALAAMGVYQHGIAKNYVNQKAVQAHVYEYTTQVSVDSDLKFKGAEKGIVPCQMIFCLKERNQRKLNSHRWFFNAFGQALNPNVCILLDVGTRPGTTSLYHLWKAFDTDSNVAGACGEIKAMKGRWGKNLLNPLVASQNFEYKMSNILDKPLESVFGYITVLPGALSAYRYHALQNDETGHGPLSQYFKGETLHGQHADVFTANMYLAEDRILCWELVAKRGERWVLKYVKGCKGETDVPETVPEFISQRRRWLNGAFFAAVYSLVHFRQLWQTDHTAARKILLHIEFAYQLLQLMFTYFSLANFYLTFYFVAGGLADTSIDPFGSHIGLYIFTVLRYTCVLLIATQFILSLGNRPQGAKKLYLTSMILYGIIMAYTTFAALYIVIHQLTKKNDQNQLAIGNNVFTNLIVSTASTIGLYFLMSFLYLDPWHMFTSSAQYFALLPSYICTLQVYAFCNTHDVTWGTKGDNVLKTDLGGAVGKGGNKVELEMPSEQLDIDSGYDEALRNLRDRVEVPKPTQSEAQMQEDYYKNVRTYMVVTWMIANGILAMAVSEAYGNSTIGDNFYLRFVLWAVASLALFRAIGSTTYALINAVNTMVEGRVRLSMKAPEWTSGFGSKVSETLSNIGSGRS